VVARWAPGTDPQRALESIAARDPSGLCAAEAARLASPPAPPDGWDTHPLTGREQAFFPTGSGITVNAGWTSAIIRHPAEMTLTPTLRLRWSWRIDTLPSRLPEDTALTHDYLSVAVEYDDGQDFTWYWSCRLPEGCSFRCPLPHWRRRETHIAARTGTAGLGRWIDQKRPCSPTTKPRSAGRRPHAWFAHGSSRKPSLKQATRRESSAESSSPMGTRRYACSDRRTTWPRQGGTGRAAQPGVTVFLTTSSTQEIVEICIYARGQLVPTLPSVPRRVVLARGLTGLGPAASSMNGRPRQARRY